MRLPVSPDALVHCYMISGGLRDKLTTLLYEVVEARFMYYGWQMWPLELDPLEWVVEVRRNRPPAPAMGSVVELAHILERYLWSAGMHVAELVQGDRDGMAFVVGVR